MRRFWLVAAAAVAAAVLAGCPGVHDSFPTTACTTDRDCYAGETCMSATVCVKTQSTDMSAPGGVEDMVGLPGGDS